MIHALWIKRGQIVEKMWKKFPVYYICKDENVDKHTNKIVLEKGGKICL